MKKLLAALVFLHLSITGFAQDSNLRIKHFNLENNLAIQGYDPVAYFSQKKAVIGKKEITAAFEGIVYNFSSAPNKNIFLKNPAVYEPQFGGWCAFAMGDTGKKVAVDPETFKIINGKLFLFYNAFFNNTLKSWNKEEDNVKKKAESNWSKIYN